MYRYFKPIPALKPIKVISKVLMNNQVKLVLLELVIVSEIECLKLALSFTRIFALKSSCNFFLQFLQRKLFKVASEAD